MKIPIYQVDAFANRQFAGNPAAVCPLDSWLDDETLQAIASENNLAETAYFVARDDGSYDLRWFTPSFEIPLCGHATLAAGYTLFNYRGHTGDTIRFHTKSGALGVSQEGNRLVMDFPAYEMESAELTDEVSDALGGTPTELLRAGINYYAIYENEDAVRSLEPDFKKIADLMRGTDIIGYVPTAKGAEYDFVSRYFAPETIGDIGEDPVTGSIHSALVPYWANRLGQNKLNAYQASSRGGELFCELRKSDGEQRVMIGGEVKPYLQGFIELA